MTALNAFITLSIIVIDSIIFYLLYAYYKLDVLPLLFTCIILATFSTMVLALQTNIQIIFGGKRVLKEDRIAVWMAQHSFDKHVDIYNCVQKAVDGFMDFRYKDENFGRFVHEDKNYACIIEINNDRLFVVLQERRTKILLRLFTYNFRNGEFWSRMESEKLKQIADEIRHMETLWRENN